MTQDEAERRVWQDWADAARHCLGCEVRVEPSRTRRYVWGWAVCLAPARPEECDHPWPYHLYVCLDRDGRTEPVGTKGVGMALARLGFITPADERGLSASQVRELWGRLGEPWD